MGYHNYQWRKLPISLALLTSLIVCVCLAPAVLADTSASDLQITLDATDISRKLIHSTITINRGEDSLSLLFPKWIPGLHGPCGPIENLAGFKVSDPTGAPIPWERDFADPFRFNIHNSDAQFPVTTTLSYICNQPTTISYGSDCAGTPTLAVINWNTVSVYPEGSIIGNLKVQPRLILPDGWKYATAMPVKESRGDTLVFETVTYEELIDFPVICGLYLKTIQLQTKTSADYFVHVAPMCILKIIFRGEFEHIEP
jgi:predicted metalloprotease with PDZ domain